MDQTGRVCDAELARVVVTLANDLVIKPPENASHMVADQQAQRRQKPSNASSNQGPRMEIFQKTEEKERVNLHSMGAS